MTLVKLLHLGAHCTDGVVSCVFVPGPDLDADLFDLCTGAACGSVEPSTVPAAASAAGAESETHLIPLQGARWQVGSLLVSGHFDVAARTSLDRLADWAHPLVAQSEAAQSSEARLAASRARRRRLMAPGNLAGVIAQLATELDGPVILQHPNGLVIEVSYDAPRALALTLRRHPAEESLAEQAAVTGVPVLEQPPGSRVVGAVTGPSGLLGYVTAASAQELREEAVDILDDCLPLISYHLERSAADSRSDEVLRQQVLTGLVAGRAVPGLSAQGAQLGIDLTAPHLCLAFGGSEHADLDLTRLAVTVREASRTLSVAPSAALVGIHDNKVFAFVPPPLTTSAEGLAKRVLAGFHRGQDLLVGIGPECRTSDSFASAAADAAWAVDVLRRRGATSALVQSADLGVFGLLFDHGRADALAEYIKRWLGPLQDYDARHRSDLVQTLKEHFKHPSLVATADALHVHVSTLKYRLKRIQTISGVDLADHDAAFNLALAVRLREGLDHLAPPVAATSSVG